MSEEELLLCKRCKKMYMLTKIDYFNHIKVCKGINPDSPIGITWMSWPPSPQKEQGKSIEIKTTISKIRPKTRG